MPPPSNSRHALVYAIDAKITLLDIKRRQHLWLLPKEVTHEKESASVI